jgi:hypothetical protein
MINDKDMKQRLNLLKSSPSFVLKEVGDLGEAEVLNLERVPKYNGIYWVAGNTKLKCGENVESVFRVDTNSGGSIISVYWFINGGWYEHQEDAVLNALNLNQEEVFPFDWTYKIPLEEDIYHD